MLKGNLSNPTGPHLSYTNFQRYEQTLEAFLSTYPHALTITPTALAPTTFRAQLCNAVNGFLQSQGSVLPFESNLDPDLLRAYWSASIVTIRGKDVVIGPKHAVREALRADFHVADATPIYLCELASPTLDQLNALAFLYGTGAFELPAKIGKIPDGYVPIPGTALEPREDYFILI